MAIQVFKGVPALALCSALGALAQPSAPTVDAVGSVPTPLRHASAISRYIPWQEVEPGDWRRLNDAVGPAGLRAKPSAACGMPAHAASQPHRGHPAQGGGR